jgi:farnesyl diphosphate synthase/geranylgeranyl diphosphate synthase type II
VIDWTADRAAVDRALVEACDHIAPHFPPTLLDAVRYSLVGGGKRFRALLLLSSYRAAGGRGDASQLAAAVEIVHAYSLIHDDLPCMDNDDVRRGRPTVHRAFSERVATTAGVAMVPFAARMAFVGALGVGLSPAEAAAAAREVMIASGAGGMIGGQLLDLDSEGQVLDLDGLEQIHQGKTGALIRVSALLGGMAARGSDVQLYALIEFGEAIGLAFQIADDVLDITSTTERLGKTAGRDLDLHKVTYPSLLGLEPAAERAERLVDQGLAALERAGLLTRELDTLARFVVERES